MQNTHTLPFIQKLIAAAPKPKLEIVELCTNLTSCKCSICKKKNSYAMRKLDLLSKDIMSNKRIREMETELSKPTMADLLDEFSLTPKRQKRESNNKLLVA
jgi:hypothetical protein